MTSTVELIGEIERQGYIYTAGIKPSQIRKIIDSLYNAGYRYFGYGEIGGMRALLLDIRYEPTEAIYSNIVIYGFLRKMDKYLPIDTSFCVIGEVSGRDLQAALARYFSHWYLHESESAPNLGIYYTNIPCEDLYDNIDEPLSKIAGLPFFKRGGMKGEFRRYGV